MGKKRARKSYTSKGQRPNVSSSTLNSARQGLSAVEKATNKVDAWKKGLNPWITVPGPSKDKMHVKVRANTIYGDPKRSGANIFGGKPDAS